MGWKRRIFGLQEVSGEDSEAAEVEEPTDDPTEPETQAGMISCQPERGSVSEQTLSLGKPCIVLYTEGWCWVARDMLRMMREAASSESFEGYAFLHVDMDVQEQRIAAHDAGATGPYCTQLWEEGVEVNTSYRAIKTSGYLDIFLGR